ncbi:MAG: TIGR04133 family radical SAM/SPASM protein [Bacteroidales bacterium]|nr:TIGR04133 family radical SAM/SPASM protein [Bacteroidales bacterium]MBR5092971.1 TIGR04133 family radical SAM/SPASM protein [Bacteroidales bacterium]
MTLSLRQRVGLELQRSLRKTDEQLHPLRTLFWECTLRCNMSCRHCGSDCKVQPEVKDMPAADFLKVIDSITPHVDPHKVFIIFSGGEALLRDDLEQVGLELYRREYPWGVVTNGFLLDQKRLDSLLASGMHSITVSLDGFEEQHNWMRRHPQSFERATQAIKLLTQQKDLLWDIVTCVNPRNYPHLKEFKEYLVSLGVPAWRLFSIFPMGRAAHDPELQLTDEQFRGILDFIKECRNSSEFGVRSSELHVSYACEGFLGEYEQRVRDHFFHCRSGVDVASIRCDGAISGCTSVRSHMDQGNIYKDDFWEVWQNRFQVMRNHSWAKKGQCKDCKVWRYCEGSGLHLYDDNGDLLICHYNRLKSGK